MKDKIIENDISGVVISHKQYEEYMKLKNKNNPMWKIRSLDYYRCPICDYIVDNNVPPQKYCDRCGQRLKKHGFQRRH